jgi:hypothetical protein
LRVVLPCGRRLIPSEDDEGFPLLLFLAILVSVLLVAAIMIAIGFAAYYLAS